MQNKQLKNTTGKRSYKTTVLRTASLIVVMVFLFMTCCFAAGTGSIEESKAALENAVSDGTETLYNVLLAIILPFAATLMGWAGVKVLFGGEKGLEDAKKTMLRVVIAIMAVYLIPTVIVGMRNMFFASSISEFTW